VTSSASSKNLRVAFTKAASVKLFQHAASASVSLSPSIVVPVWKLVITLTKFVSGFVLPVILPATVVPPSLHTLFFSSTGGISSSSSCTTESVGRFGAKVTGAFEGLREIDGDIVGP
jgi:hypothetical protein